MFRLILLLAISLLAGASASELLAQAPAPSPSPAATAPAPAAPVPTPTADSLINSMGAADLQQAVQLLKANYIDPEALNELELNRAMLSGVISRLGRGVMLLPTRAPEATEATSPFYGEILDGHIAYLRLGALTAANLQALDAKMQTFPAKKIDAAVIDLRASPASNDFAIAAEFADRFCPKGKLLFALRKTAVKQERQFTSSRGPAYQGLMIVLADGDTSGPAEAIGGALRVYNKALLIGQPTAGRAVEFSDLPLNGGRVLRVAVAETVLPEGAALFPGGLKPDLPVEMPAADKRLVFQQSVEKGMHQFVFEVERPHMNEAALLAGRNPELDALEAAQRRGRAAEKPQTRDPVLQRAIDMVTSLAIYQQR
jgi:C-terminal processing protease CtpA/Prc